MAAPPPGGQNMMQMPPLPPEMAAMLAMMQQMQAQDEPVVSELDRWAMKHHGVRAGRLEDRALEDLIGHVRDLAERDRQYWQDRNDRIMKEDDYYQLKRPGDGMQSGSEAGKTDQDAAQNAEILVSPIPRLVVDKLTAMLAAADWPVELPARTVDGAAAAQKVENLLTWFRRQLSRQFAHTQHENLDHKMAFSGVLTGWMCALLLPDPSNIRFPWIFRLEDPCLVYPRFTDKGLVRVTRQFVMEVLEARAEYPELETMLQDYHDDDTVTVIGYYDQIYRMIVVEGMGSHNQDAMAVMRPIRHHCRTADGEPQCPWIIHLPNGKGFQSSRRAFGGAAVGGFRAGLGGGTAAVGVGALYAMWDTYDQINKIASQLATNVARSENPPTVQYLQPGQDPVPVSFAPGSRNFLLFQRNLVDILETTPNGGDLQPLMALLQDWLAKSTLPGVYWGEASGATSGFMTNLLANAAKHVLLAYASGMMHFWEMICQRAIETLLVAYTQMGVPPLTITQRIDQGRLVGGAVVTVEDLLAVDPDVEVEFMDLSQQDLAGAVQTEMMAVQGRFHARQTAMKKTGIRDTELEEARIDLDSLLADPLVAAQLGALEAKNPTMSTRERLLAALDIKTQLIQQQMAMQAQARQRRVPPAKPGVSTSTLPSEMGPGRAGMPPGREDPQQQQQRANGRMIAAISGGSPPNPR